MFDISTRTQRIQEGLKNSWHVSDGGFRRPSRHLVLQEGFDYPEYDVWLDRFIVVDDNNTPVYRNWFHDYSLKSIKPALEEAGFQIEHVWGDLSGTSYEEGGDWIAIVGKKTN